MKTLLAVLFLACSLVAQIRLRDVDAARRELRPWLDAIAQVESGGRDDAVGDNGKAIGRMQIWRVYWQDAIEHCRALQDATYEDVTERVYAERILVAYMLRYCPQAVADKDYERMSRVHNGGPRGHRKEATLGYWSRVSRALETLTTKK
jgi:hypothetical protein